MNTKHTLLHKKTILIVTGGPGTGKSYAAARLNAGIDGLTLLSYDSIKESEWDRFGFDNAEQKARLNRFCLEEFYLTLQHMMWEEKTILIEYPFNMSHYDSLKELIDAAGYHAVTLLLYGDWKTIYRRGINRDRSSAKARHPGHLTNTYHREKGVRKEDFIPDAVLTYEQFRADIDRKNYDIQLGYTIRADVTDFSTVDYDAILKEILESDASLK